MFQMAVRGCPIGVTGGIGAGKTAVLRVLAELGAATVDADDVVHSLYAPGQAGQKVVQQRWGKRVLAPDGSVDRAALAETVFTAPGELRWLNGVIHPMVQDRINNLAEQTDGPLFCGIPLLFEVGWERFVRFTVSVWCDVSVQMERLARRGWAEGEIRRRLDCQTSMDEKLRRGDFAIVNNGSWGLLREQCRLLKSRIDCLANGNSVFRHGET
jgi:dephospho-CoA kinase